MDSRNRIQGLFASYALLPSGWATDVSITFDSSGTITDVKIDASSGDFHVAAGPVIPGMINLHSHAFQRSIAGRTQSFSRIDDDFWTWREAMYGISSEIGPEDLEEISFRLYSDMIRNGYTTVCEFHYLHHDRSGHPYSNPAEMSLAIVRAADRAGIRLTLLPVLYCQGGFSEEPLFGAQLRFAHDVDGYLSLIDRLQDEVSDNIVLGYAPHSLRAVDDRSLKTLLDHRSVSDNHTAPVHIHIAEQTAEVDQCLEAHRARPVEYLFTVSDPDSNWCLVHATHTTPAEKQCMGRSKACVGLCPTTEADLGDGLFDLPGYLSSGGRFGIGSDSNLCVSPAEELRLLEYTQRLSLRRRNITGEISPVGVGTQRYLQALDGGRHASGQSAGRIEAGYQADLVVLEPNTLTTLGEPPDVVLNAHVFSGNERSVRETIIGGLNSAFDRSAH